MAHAISFSKKSPTFERLRAKCEARSWAVEPASLDTVKDGGRCLRFSFEFDKREGSLLYNPATGYGIGHLTNARTEFTTDSPYDGINWFDSLKLFVYDEQESIAILLNRTYRAKRPSNADGFVNDRVVRWIGDTEIQYDGPAVGFGAKYPRITKAAFAKWADRDVTDELPGGEWAPWNDENRKANK